MPHKLTDIEVHEVSLVDFGANYDKKTGEGAKVTLFKRGDMEKTLFEKFKDWLNKEFAPELETNDTGGQMSEQKDLESKVNELTEQLETANKRAEEAEKKAEELEAKVKEAEESQKTETEKKAEEIEAMPEDVRKRFEELEKRAEEAEKIAKAEQEKRELAEFTKRAEQYTSLPFEASETGALMLKLSRALDKEEFEKIEQIFAASEEFAKQAGITESIGKSGTPQGSSAHAKIEKMASDLVKEGKHDTIEKARAAVYEAHPELVEQQRQEAN